MIRYKLYQLKNENNVKNGYWYARAVADMTYDIPMLAKHMSEHNTPYSPGVIKGVLTDMIVCIKELCLDGKSVKLEDLAIFSIGVKSKGVQKVEDFTPAEHITGVRMRARGTGSFVSGMLSADARLKQLTKYDLSASAAKESGLEQ